MLNNIIIGRYYKTSSLIHNIHALIKLISLIVYIIMLFQITSIVQIILSALFLVIIMTLTKVPALIYLRSLYGLRYLILSLIFINYIGKINGIESVISITRVSLIVLYSTLISLTTKTEEIMEALETMFKPLKFIGIQTTQMSFILVNAIRFIPILIDNTNNLISSQYTYIPKDGNFKTKMETLKNTFVPIFINSINGLDYIIASLELRQYNFDNFEKGKMKIKVADIIYILSHIMIFIIIGGGI